MNKYTALSILRKADLTEEQKEAVGVLAECQSPEDIMDMEWEFGVILQNYAYNKDRNDTEQEYDIKELYAKSVALTAKECCGLVFVIDDFIEDVRNGSFIDYDGSAHALDADGNRMDNVPAYCNLKVLEKAKKNGAVFIAWYNK